MPAAQIAESLAALATVLVLIMVAGRLARTRLVPSGATPALRLRATLALDTRRRLHLVDTETGAVLVLTGGAQDQMLPWPASRTDA